MRMQRDKPLYFLPSIVGIVVLLFSTAGVARIMGWLPNATYVFADTLAIEPLTEASAKARSSKVNLTPSPMAGNAPTRRRCAECGVIAAMRKIEVSGENASLSATDRAAGGNRNQMRVKSAKSYEFTVRLNDGSYRVITDANPAAWRLGERVNIIDGMNPSNS